MSLVMPLIKHTHFSKTHWRTSRSRRAMNSGATIWRATAARLLHATQTYFSTRSCHIDVLLARPRDTGTVLHDKRLYPVEAEVKGRFPMHVSGVLVRGIEIPAQLSGGSGFITSI
jgi:hypothetical protein